MTQNVAMKDNARKNVRAWNEGAAAAIYLLRAAHTAPTTLNTAVLANMVRAIAEPDARMLEMVLSLSGFDIAAFGPPVPPQLKGNTHQRTFDIHFGVFVNVMKVMIDFGSQQASAVSKSRTQALLVELHEKQTMVSTYMNYHDTELSQDRDNVRARTIADANKDLLTFSGELHDAAMTLKLRHPFSPPANGTGPAIRPPLFTRLTSLVIEDSAQSLVGRMDIGLKMSTASARGNTGTAGKKRKAAAVGQPGGATSSAARPRLTSAPQQPPARSTFAQSILDWQTPSDVCAHAWKGQQCGRLANNRTCNYDHNRRHPSIQQPPSGPPPPPPGPPPSRPPPPPSALAPPPAPSVAPSSAHAGQQQTRVIARYSGRGGGGAGRN